MTFLPWVRQLLTSKSRSGKHLGRLQKPDGTKLLVEQLECRLAPANFTWTGNGADRNWSTGLNWQGNTAPTGIASDSLTFSDQSPGSFVSNNDITGGTFNSITFNASGYFILGNSLTLNGGITTTNTSGSNVVLNNLTLGASESFTSANAGSTLVLGGTLTEGGNTPTFGGAGNTVLNSTTPSAITGTGGLIKTGTGTLTVSSSNNYTGITTISQGVVNIQSNTALGASSSGTTVASGAALQMQGGISVAEPIQVDGTGVNTLGAIESVNGANTLTGTVTLGGNAALGADLGGQLTVSVSGTITDGASSFSLTKVGPGTLQLLSPTNSFDGGTTVAAGTLAVGTAGALGSGTLVLQNGSTLGDTGASITIGNPVTLSGADTFSVSGTLTFSGIVSGSGSLIKAGAGTLQLTNTETYTGPTTVNAGTLAFAGGGEYQPATAPGANAVQSLIFNGSISGGTFTLSFNGATSAPITWDPVAANLAANIQAALNGLTTVGPTNGAVVASGSTSSLAATFTVTFQGALAGLALPTMSAAFAGLGSGTIAISTATAGFASFNLNGGRLLLDNTTVNDGDRIIDTATVALNGGTFEFQANNAAAAVSAETMGTLTLVGGLSTVQVGYAAAPAANVQSTVTFASLNRPLTGATVNFVGNNQALGGPAAAATFNRIIFTAAPTLVGGSVTTPGGVLPYAEVQGPGNAIDLASYNQGATPNVGIAAYSGYSVNPTNPGAGDIVQITANTTFTTNSVGALLIAAGASTNVTLTEAVGGLNITSGALLTSGTGTSTVTINSAAGNTLTFGSEGSVFQNNAGTGNTVIGNNIVITGSMPLTVAGANTFDLGNISHLNTGGTFLDGGTLIVRNNNNFGSGAGTLTLTNGTLNNLAGAGLTFNNAVNLNGTVTFTGNTFTFQSLVNGVANNTLAGTTTTVSSNSVLTALQNVTFNQVITGTGSVTLGSASTATLTLAGANTFSGGTTLQAGTLALNTNTAAGTGTLTLAGGALSAAANLAFFNPVALSGTVALSGNAMTFHGAVTLTGTNSLTANVNTIINGVVVGGPALTLTAGAGALTLNNANTYAGGTVVNGGILSVGNNNALGSGVLTLTGGTIQSNLATTLGNIVNFGTTGAVTVTVGNGANPLTFAGLVTLVQNTTLTVNNTGGTTFAGLVTGPGTLTLGGGVANSVLFLPTTNTYTGGTILNSTAANLTVVLGSNGALGTGTLTLQGGALMASSALTLTNSLALNGTSPTALTGSNAITFSPASGTIAVNASTTLVVNNATTFAGSFSTSNPTFAVTFNPALGTATLGGDNSGYTGNFNLNMLTQAGISGTLATTNANALGGSGTLSLQSGVLQSSATIGMAVQMTGANPVIFVGNPIFTSAVTLTATATIEVASGNTATFNSAISGATFGLILAGTPVVTLANNGNAQAVGGTVKLTAANGYTGPTTINSGTLLLTGAGGKLTGSNAITVNNSGTLTLDNSVANGGPLANRLAAANTVLTLGGGSVNLVGTTSESVLQLSLQAGQSSIDTGSGNATFAFTSGVAGLLRAAGATVNFTGSLGTATNKVTFTTAPTLVNSILPYATVGGTDWATIGANGVTAFAGYVGMPASPGAGTENVRLSGGTTTITANTTINSLVLDNGANLIINPGVTLTIQGGASGGTTSAGLLTTGGSSTISGGGTVAFPSAVGNDGLLLTDSSSATTLTLTGVTITGANLVIGGAGTVALNSTNLHTGTTFLDNGTLSLGVASALGITPAAQTLVITNGTVQTTQAGGLTLINPVTFNNATVTLGGANSIPVLFAGASATQFILQGTNNTLTVPSGMSIALNGTMTGAGTANLIKAGVGTLVLTHGATASTYSGATVITAGIVQAQASNAFGNNAGAGVVVANTTSVQVLGSGLNVNHALFLYGSGTDSTGALRNLNTGAGTGNTWSGAVTLVGATSIGVDVGTTLTLNTGVVTGPADLTKIGLGTLTLAGANTYVGQTTVNAGVLNVGSALGLGIATGAVVVNNNTSLQVAANATVVGKTVTVNGTGFGNVGAVSQGAFVNTANANTWTGNVAIAPGALIAATGGSLTINGVVSGTDVTKVGTATVTLANVNTFTGNLAVIAGILQLSNVNVYSGSTTISGAAIGGAFVAGQLTLTNLGSALNSPSFTVNQNCTLLLDNAGGGPANATTGFNSPNRISSSASIALNTAGTGGSVTGTGSGLVFNASNNIGIASSQTFGPVTINNGQSFIQAGYGNPGNVAPTNAVQTIIFNGVATGTGSFTLSLGSLTTLPIAWSQTNGIGAGQLGGNIQAALNTLLGTNNAVVANPAGSIYTITFQNAQGGIAQTPMTANTSGVGGGGSVSSIATTTLGGPAFGVQSTLTLTSLTRNGNATVNFVGTFQALGAPAVATTFNRIAISNNAPIITQLQGNNGGILPYATVQLLTANVGNNGTNPFDFASYNQGTPANVGIAAYSGYVTSLAAAAAGDIVLVSAGANGIPSTISGNVNQSIGALLIANTNTSTTATTIAVNPLGSLTLTVGTLLTTGGASAANGVAIGSGVLNLANEGIVYQYETGTGNTTINATIIGSTTLVVAGANVLSLAGSNVYTGGTILNAGTLLINNALNLGTGTVTLNGGSYNSNLAIANPVNLNGVVAFGTGNNTFLGTTTLTSNVVLIPNNNVFFQGAVVESGGSRSITIAGGGQTAVFNNANTYTGGTILAGGNLQVGHGNALGSGTLTVVAGTINSNVAVNLPNNVVLPNATLSTNTGDNLEFSGSVTMTGVGTINVTGGGLVKFSGVISGPSGGANAGLNVTGGGTLTLTNTGNNYLGGTSLASATLVVNNANVLPSAGPLIINGAVLFGTSNLTFSQTLILGGAGAAFNGLFTDATSPNTMTFNGPVMLTGAPTLTVINATMFNGVIGESGGARALTMGPNTGAAFGSLTLNGAGYFSGFHY